MMKVGDRVITKEQVGIILRAPNSSTAEVIEVGDGRLKIRLLKRYNVSGTLVETWVSSDEVSIDKQWYREEKINKICS